MKQRSKTVSNPWPLSRISVVPKGAFMVSRLKASLVVGTRPEAIKIAPIVLAMAAAPDQFQAQLVSTGQHRAMLDRAFGDFGITPDIDLNVMRDRQTLPELTSRVDLLP
jgi:UDP-N-acetylglucosamine 2-epimerase (non-hydrolysing)